MIHLYIITCSDGSYYTGTSKDLNARLWQHNSGFGGKYTSQMRPVKLVFSQQFEKYYDAYKAERQIKNWSRKKKEALINNDFNELIRLSNFKKNPSTSSG